MIAFLVAKYISYDIVYKKIKGKAYPTKLKFYCEINREILNGEGSIFSSLMFFYILFTKLNVGKMHKLCL